MILAFSYDFECQVERKNTSIIYRRCPKIGKTCLKIEKNTDIQYFDTKKETQHKNARFLISMRWAYLLFYYFRSLHLGGSTPKRWRTKKS